MNDHRAISHRDFEPSLDTSTWGPWASAVWSGLVLVLVMVVAYVMTVVVMQFLFPALATLDEASLARAVQGNGSTLSISTVLAALLGVPLLVGVARLRKGVRLRSYFALRQVSPRVIGEWVVALMGFLLAWDLLGNLAGRPFIDHFMRQMYGTADPRWALVLALVVAAPLWEEVMFRGFLFAGWIRSALGPLGTIFLTSLAWAMLHWQYSWVDMINIFFSGLFLGAARYRSGSIWVPLSMHAAQNASAVLVVAVWG